MAFQEVCHNLPVGGSQKNSKQAQPSSGFLGYVSVFALHSRLKGGATLREKELHSVVSRWQIHRHLLADMI